MLNESAQHPILCHPDQPQPMVEVQITRSLDRQFDLEQANEPNTAAGAVGGIQLH
ncbi:MAG: hypothetical protein HYY13_01465 [Nitrospirae bacterium]|nr:hypothetical protein [Nitrospirota bacterium]